MNLRADHIYRTFLRLTRRLSNSQIMMLLAVVVGVLAGVGTYLFEMLLYGIKYGLTNWFPVDSAHILFLIYPAVGIILATLFVKYIVRDNISEGVTRVLYAMSSRNSRIAGHNCWTTSTPRCCSAAAPARRWPPFSRLRSRAWCSCWKS